MGFYSSWLFPRVLDLAMKQEQITPFRERIGAAASGRVLDLGIGSGVNLRFYGAAARSIVGIDPSLELLRFAEERGKTASCPVELLRASGEQLPIEDKTIDTVVVTFTLCSVTSAEKVLAETRRVLRPGGKLLFAEHGRAPDAGVARWQDRLTPVWKRVAGGCHLNRKPDDLITSAGFRIEHMDTGYLPRGPRPMTFVYSGSGSPV